MAESPPSVGAKSLIAAHVVISGWQIEIGATPDEPDKCITIYDTQVALGFPHDPSYGAG